MNSVSKVKIAVGYTLLLGVLFFSLFFVHREMEHLMLSDNRDVQWTDSLITLLRKKDANTHLHAARVERDERQHGLYPGR